MERTEDYLKLSSKFAEQAACRRPVEERAHIKLPGFAVHKLQIQRLPAGIRTEDVLIPHVGDRFPGDLYRGTADTEKKAVRRARHGLKSEAFPAESVSDESAAPAVRLLRRIVGREANDISRRSRASGKAFGAHCVFQVYRTDIRSEFHRPGFPPVQFRVSVRSQERPCVLFPEGRHIERLRGEALAIGRTASADRRRKQKRNLPERQIPFYGGR